MIGTPLRQQYLDIKRRHPDAILLFRIGDFYEAFDDDARIISRELGIVLTSKPMGRNVRVPLAGVPHHSLERHLATLIARGHRVAICEQLTAAPVKGESGRGLIERDVVRVVTPGTIIEPGLLRSKVNNYLAAFCSDGRRAGIAYADVTTGEFAATELEATAALSELQRLTPSEILVSRSCETPDSDLPGFITRCDDEFFVPQLAQLIQLVGIARANNSNSFTAFGQLVRDSFANNTRRHRARGQQPLLDVTEIMRRHDHVAWFVEHGKARAELFAALEFVHDLERLSGRVRAGLASAQEALALGQSLETLPRVRAVLQKDQKRFENLLAALPACAVAARVIREAIADELPKRSEGVGIIRAGYSDELDKLRELLQNGKTYLAEMEQRERARTGIKSLRVGYNKVFGHYIEVTRPNLHLVPESYTRKQTLAQAERFVTLELKEHESLVVNAHERIGELETNIFRQVCAEIGRSRDEILVAASTVAYLDVIASFAEVAAEFKYVRPVISETPVLRVTAGRHPVLERMFAAGAFVANDVKLSGENAPEIVLITGPNMSGKSTYLRQTALIVLMAQAGCFVPATHATVGLCDRIFTRIGLYDRLGSGESTFMTEMVETAQILHHASQRSLILLDELGRGTSTYDGLAVARAVLEYIHNHPQLRAKTLFATHYHELT
ncbi:MAG: DNA mismatch repair protein MutS, partial [Acidobacteria bacterium]|nr:DNA mismatch repair protein MutS [Acidobacteriota bacterium]